MAFTQSSLVDILFKKYITNKSTLDNSKQYFEETYNSRKEIVSGDIWLQSDQIQQTAATVSGVVQLITATLSYFSGSKGSFYNPSLVDIIPFNYGDGTSYDYLLYRNDGVTRIYPGEADWLFDNNAGVLTFFATSGVNGGTVSNGSGVVIATSTLPPVLKAWKYIGKKGVIPNLSGLTYSGSTMSVNIGSGLSFSNNAISVNIGSGLTFSGNQIQTLVNTISGNGLTNSGNTFSILLDPLTPGLTLSSSGLKLINSLIVVTSSVTIGTNAIGQYTTDPTTNPVFGNLSIPNKGYVDSIASGLNLKQSVRVAATGSISINSAPSQIDGVSLSSGDRVLLWRQDGTSNGTSSNGIYVFNGTGATMTRATDFDGSPISEVTTGSYTFVTEGSTYQGAGFVIIAIGTASGNIQVGTQSMRWTQFNSVTNYTWNNGLISTGTIIDVDLANNSGLTFSSGQLLVSLPTNSGLELNSGGLSINSNISGTGITFSTGKISLTNPIYFGNGITNSGNTYSVNINSNGLTFSNSSLSLNVGSGLTFSNSQLLLNIGTGLTFSGNVLINNSVVSIGNGLTSSGVTYSVLLGDGLIFSGGAIFAKTLTNTGLYVNSGNGIYIDWASILGSGLTWSGSVLNTTSALLQKYSTTLTFTAGITQTVTHNLGNSDFVVQMYDSTTGDEIMAQYTSRTTSSVGITTFEDVGARVVIIG